MKRLTVRVIRWSAFVAIGILLLSVGMAFRFMRNLGERVCDETDDASFYRLVLQPNERVTFYLTHPLDPGEREVFVPPPDEHPFPGTKILSISGQGRTEYYWYAVRGNVIKATWSTVEYQAPSSPGESWLIYNDEKGNEIVVPILVQGPPLDVTQELPEAESEDKLEPVECGEEEEIEPTEIGNIDEEVYLVPLVASSEFLPNLYISKQGRRGAPKRCKNPCPRPCSGQPRVVTEHWHESKLIGTFNHTVEVEISAELSAKLVREYGIRLRGRVRLSYSVTQYEYKEVQRTKKYDACGRLIGTYTCVRRGVQNFFTPVWMHLVLGYNSNGEIVWGPWVCSDTRPSPPPLKKPCGR